MPNSYETFIELVAPFFENEGFQYYTPKSITWNGELMSKDWRKERNWKSQTDLRIPDYQWFNDDIRFDSFESGVFVKVDNNYEKYKNWNPQQKKRRF